MPNPNAPEGIPDSLALEWPDGTRYIIGTVDMALALEDECNPDAAPDFGKFVVWPSRVNGVADVILTGVSFPAKSDGPLKATI